MKRKRSEDTEEVRKRNTFTKDHLLLMATQLQLEYNRHFFLPYNNMEILRLVQEQTSLDTIAKIIEIVQVCVDKNEYKTTDVLKNMI